MCLFAASPLQEKPSYQFSLYFGGGSYFISQDQQQALQQFLLQIPHVEQYRVTIHSHTDNIGGTAFNNWLSQMRSQSAMKQLMRNNIRRDMMEIRDFGMFNPVYDNNTQEGRMKNRRVDIFFWPLVL